MGRSSEFEAEMEIEREVEHEVWLEENGYSDEESYNLIRAEQMSEQMQESEQGDADEKFYTKIYGVTYDNRQELISKLRAGDSLLLKREPDNPYDENAIAFQNKRGEKLGYVSKKIASWMADLLDNDTNISATVESVTGGNGYNRGVNILLEIHFLD